MAILKNEMIITRETLEKAGFDRKEFDKNLSKLMGNENIYERQWIISDNKGRIIIYYDVGNSWCNIMYCSDGIEVSDTDINTD